MKTLIKDGTIVNEGKTNFLALCLKECICHTAADDKCIALLEEV